MKIKSIYSIIVLLLILITSCEKNEVDLVIDIDADEVIVERNNVQDTFSIMTSNFKRGEFNLELWGEQNEKLNIYLKDFKVGKQYFGSYENNEVVYNRFQGIHKVFSSNYSESNSGYINIEEINYEENYYSGEFKFKVRRGSDLQDSYIIESNFSKLPIFDQHEYEEDVLGMVKFIIEEDSLAIRECRCSLKNGDLNIQASSSHTIKRGALTMSYKNSVLPLNKVISTDSLVGFYSLVKTPAKDNFNGEVHDFVTGDLILHSTDNSTVDSITFNFKYEDNRDPSNIIDLKKGILKGCE